MRPLTSLGLGHHQTCLTQHGEVVRDPGLRHVQPAAQLPHGRRFGEFEEDPLAHRVGYCRQQGRPRGGERAGSIHATMHGILNRRGHRRSPSSPWSGDGVVTELPPNFSQRDKPVKTPDSRSGNAVLPQTLTDLSPEELEDFALDEGQPAYRGRQLARALYVQNVATLDEVTVLPQALRERWSRHPGLAPLQVVASESTAGGSTKHLIALADGARIEAVAIPREDANFTYCLSSQVGCRMGCVFCATGRMGIIRQLSTAEIVEQVRLLSRLNPGRSKPNLVFMGMG